MGSFGLGGRLWHWHGWDVLAVNEIHSVGVDDSRVVILGLDFEIVGYQVDGALRHQRVVRSVRLLVEATATTAAPAAAFSPATVGRPSLVLIVMSSSGVLAAVVLLLLELAVTATSVHPLAIVRLLVPGVLLVTAHMGLVRVPGLRLARVVETTLIVLLEVSVLLLLMLSLLLILLVV